MKAPCILLFALATAAAAQDEPPPPDPTRASPRMRAALLAGGGIIPELRLRGVVLGASRESALVMIEIAEGARVLVRPGVPFSVMADGEARKLLVKRIDGDGIEIEAVDQGESVLLPGFGLIRAERSGLPGDVEFVEFREVPLLDALKMLSDQTGLNFSASAEANKIPVNAMLRNVAATSVVEEICKSHGLWFRRDPSSGILRIMTVGEFEKDLSGYREEQTAVFTLKYPNVAEIAVAIADLFGDRVRLSLGPEEKDDDMRRDLEERFDRFDILNERTQNAAAISGTILGNNVNGVANVRGRSFGFGGFNSDFSGDRSSSSRRRSSQRQLFRDEAAAETEPMTAAQAERIEEALIAAARGDRSAADIGTMRGRPAPVYVTASRRNNMVIVRTADARAMDDIRAIVERLDVQTPMVLLEVKVLSIELGKGFESAFEYAVSDGRIGGSFSTGVINPSVARDPITDAPVGVVPFPGLGSTGLRDGQFIFQYLGDSVRARIQLLASKNRVKTLATPTLLTSNNEVSRLFLGEERPLVRGISSQTILTDNNVATTPNTETEFRNVGNTLLITPNINADRTVTLRLVQENSFISPNGANIPVVTAGTGGDRDNNGLLPGNGRDRGRETGVAQVPVDVVGTRSVSGTFVAKDGMEVAIGGLIEEVDSDRREGVPILGDIPGLGILFRRQSTEKSRRELVVILRPYVMSTPADGGRVSRDMLERLAPESVDRLLDEGFLPALPPPPAPRPAFRPAPSAAASRKAPPTPAPVAAPVRKKSTPQKRPTGK
jgi:general secretion pathway protein D